MKFYGWKDVVVGASIATAARASVIEGRAAAPDTVQTWKDWTCPMPSTVSLSFTEYVPVTTTQNQTATTTIYQTVVSTEIITTVSFVTILECDMLTSSRFRVPLKQQSRQVR